MTYNYEVKVTNVNGDSSGITASATTQACLPDTYVLSLKMIGTGTGTVSSTPAGTACGIDCLAYLDTTVVSLIAVPDTGSAFDSWNCTPDFTSGNPLTADTICTATFTANQTPDPIVDEPVVEPKPANATPVYVPLPSSPETTVIVAFGGDGKGKVTSDPSGVDCQAPNACSYTFRTEETIQLIPMPVGHSRFQNWGTTCRDGIISPDGQTHHCMVYFVDTTQYTLNVSKTGLGTGTVIAQNIDCGDDCTEAYGKGYQLTVSAVAGENSQFMGWQGDCSGTNNVIGIVMDNDKNCIAVFDVIPEVSVVELEPVTPELEPVVDDTTPPIDDGQTPPADDPVVDDTPADELVVGDEEPVTLPVAEEPPVQTEPPVVDEEPIEPPVVEEQSVVTEEPIEPPVVDEAPQPLPEPERMLPLLPAMNDKPCPPKAVLSYYCNAHGQTVGNLNIVENPQSTNGVGFLSNATVTGTVILNPCTWISNLQVSETGIVIGGVVTGLNYNNGYMGDFEFRGGFIKGGTLGGTIVNASKIFNFYEDVNLAPGAYLIGGALKGTIQGDSNNPALLENLRILSGSVVSNVMLGDGVSVDENVVLTLTTAE